MNPRITTLVIALGAALYVQTANAGPCAVEVVQFRSSLPPSGSGEVVGSAPQTIGAQLRHQPTPASVERAEKGAQMTVEDTLALAEKRDAEGDQAACQDALARAKLLVDR